MKSNMETNYILSQGLDVTPPTTTTMLERKRGETIRVIEGRVRQIGEKVRDNVERRVRDGTNERQSA